MKTVRRLMVFALAAVLVMPVAAMAATSISVTPLTRELTVSPGQTVKGSLDVTNAGDASATFFPVAKDFIADPENPGAPKFISDEEKSAGFSTGVSEWISFEQVSIEIPAKGTKSFSYSISVPTDAEPGSHFGAVFAGLKPASELKGSGASIGGSVGSLILLTVTGDIKVSGAVTDFVALDAQETPRSIFQSMPIDLKLTIANTGNVHLAPEGNVKVLKGKNVVTSFGLNEEGGRVLPGSSRTYTERLSEPVGYGKFSVSADVMMKSPDGKEIAKTVTTSFWILPLNMMMLGLVILLLVLGLFRMWVKHHDALMRANLKSK